MIRPVVLLALALAAAMLPAQARLGETLDECVSRYGPCTPDYGAAQPAADGTVAYLFKSYGYTYSISFKEGAASCETINRLDHLPIPDAQITAQRRARATAEA
ncbi:MAG: hypothetical protein WDO13_10370 [Verrucomicrobiota bacterium]